MGMSVTISAATEQDAEQILKLQFLCYQSEAALYGDYSIEPLTQPLDSLKAELTDGTVLRTKGFQVIPRGKRLRLLLPGGGGMGDPAQRNPALVGRDIADGLV